MPKFLDPKNRNKPEGILEAVARGGHLRLDTLHELLRLLAERTNYHHHIAVEIETGPLLKTIDNEEDAQETIRRLRAQPIKNATAVGLVVTLDESLAQAIDDYLATDWKSKDPSKIGALNAVAYIGERVAAIAAAQRGKHGKI